MTETQISALQMIAKAVLDTIREMGPNGAPAGHLYAALMAQGCTMNQFEQIMSALVRTGKVTKEGHCYFAV